MKKVRRGGDFIIIIIIMIAIKRAPLSPVVNLKSNIMKNTKSRHHDG